MDPNNFDARQAALDQVWEQYREAFAAASNQWWNDFVRATLYLSRHGNTVESRTRARLAQLAMTQIELAIDRAEAIQGRIDSE